MKAMVFAAGLGTRLRPLTAERPKALVTIAGHTLLEITLARLRAFGVREVVINVHHYAGMIADYLQANRNFGMTIALSREDTLLDTGGGLQKALPFFFTPGSNYHQPFLVHNVDVLSTIDLAAMVRFHTEQKALATLAVQQRPTSRPLLFDQQGRLCGRGAAPGTAPAPAGPAQSLQSLAFCGIHVLSPRIFSKLDGQGAFSIVDAYVKLAVEGDRILGFRADQSYWLDLGKPENIAQAERDIAAGKYSLASGSV
jgi:NDP-sugar pyrophosphorylase family protein